MDLAYIIYCKHTHTECRQYGCIYLAAVEYSFTPPYTSCLWGWGSVCVDVAGDGAGGGGGRAG